MQYSPRMKNTQTFKNFENNFDHLFSECERGFINELVINMFCQIYAPGRTVINYKSQVNQLYFVQCGTIECYNNEKDELIPNYPIFYLPRYSYFGDFQILNSLKSNIIFRSLTVPSDILSHGKRSCHG